MSHHPPALTPRELTAVLDPVYVDRGRRYAEEGRVVRADWNADSASLRGHIDGSRGRTYTTTAYWIEDRDRRLRFDGGECSCPMQADCKHVAALVLAAPDTIGDGASQRAEPAMGNRRPPGRDLRPAGPTWRQTLGRWAADHTRAGTELAIPLGIHLTVTTPPSGHSSGTAPALTARLIQRGPNGWVSRNLDWRTITRWSADSTLGQHDGVLTVFDDEHVRLATAIHALSSAISQFGTYGTKGRTLDLADFPHPQLWPLLAAAEDAGMPLRTGRAGSDAVRLLRGAPAEVRVDVTRAPGVDGAGRLVTPAVWLDGRRVRPLAFLGEPAHGLVLAPTDAGDVPDDEPAPALVLTRLRNPVPTAIRHAVMDGTSTRVPATDDADFLADGYLRLRALLPVISSDASFDPPEVSPPTLVARLIPESAEVVELLWGYRYRVGEDVVDGRVDEPLDDAPWRDPTAERQLLAGMAPLLGADRFAVGDAVGAPHGTLDRSGSLRPAALLLREDILDLVDRLIPGLEAHPQAEVEVMGGALPDYRDVTDQMQISVATRIIPEERDWFDLDVQLTVGDQRIPLATVFTALAEGRRRLFLQGGGHISLETPELLELRDLIEEAESLQERTGGQLRVSRYQVDLWEQLAALGVVAEQAEEWRRQVEGLRCGPGVLRSAPPPGLTANLRPYQQQGYAWLSFLAAHRIGGILADDMGLGKTVQALAMILQQRRPDGGGARAQSGPFLVLAPASVVHNWVSEAARFVPDLEVREVGSTFAKAGLTAAEVAAGADIVVTSYTRFRLDAEAYGDIAWSGLILDEAQAVKNHRSKLYGCVRRLGAPFTVAITGTPMENNLMELWSLLSIAAPGLFPNPSRFKEQYVTPIQRNRDAAMLAQLRRRIRPLVLRRTKEEVAEDLPPKQEQVVEVELTPAHRKLYDLWLQRERRKVLGLMGDLDEHRFTVLRSLTMLRLASLHAGLVEDGRAGVGSAKLTVLVDHLREIVAGGHRALVFSQFTSFLALVRDALDRSGIDHVYLDGSTRRRESVVRSFTTGEAPVFLLSLKAGGVGLNLTEADYCFLLDPWWNPATEAQAIDRAHRIGQTRTVMVYRLIASGTIEEKVLDLSRRKADLVDGVMTQGRRFDGKLTPEDIAELFS